jgi:hypothetical protein
MSKPLSPSVVQLFSMSSSISTVTSDPSDSGIESIKSSKHSTSSHHHNFRARGNSDIAYRKQYKNNNASIHHATNNNNIKFIKTRASSLSPTKNIITTTPKHNINTPNSPQTAKRMTMKAKQQSQLLPPRFSMKKQVSAPASQNSSSYKPTAINKSEPTFRNKKLTSTAMNRKLNTPPHHDNTDSNINKNQQGNLSDSGSSKSEARSSKSTKSNKSEKSSSNKKFCRTANFVNAGNNNNQHQRQRNNDSFCGTVFKDEMWAGSAAPPDATALPKPPTDWIKKMSLKQEEDGVDVNAAVFENKKCSKNKNKASANPTTTKQPPLANSVQQMFASFNPLVSTTA